MADDTAKAKSLRQRRARMRARVLRNSGERLSRVSSSPITRDLAKPSPTIPGVVRRGGSSGGLSVADKRKLRLSRMANRSRTVRAAPAPKLSAAPPTKTKAPSMASPEKSSSNNDKPSMPEVPAIAPSPIGVQVNTKDARSEVTEEKSSLCSNKSVPHEARAGTASPTETIPQSDVKNSCMGLSIKSVGELGITFTIASWAVLTVAYPLLVGYVFPTALLVTLVALQLEAERLSLMAIVSGTCKSLCLYVFFYGLVDAMSIAVMTLLPELSTNFLVASVVIGAVALIYLHRTGLRDKILRTAAVLSAQLKYRQMVAAWPLANKGAAYRWVQLQDLRAFAAAQSHVRFFDQAFAHLVKTKQVTVKAEDGLVAWISANEWLPSANPTNAAEPKKIMSTRDRRMQQLRRRRVAQPAPKFADNSGSAPKPLPTMSTRERRMQQLQRREAQPHRPTDCKSEDIAFEDSVD